MTRNDLNPQFIFGTDIGFRLYNTIIQGNSADITILNLPKSPTTLPWSWKFTIRKIDGVTMVGGKPDYFTGEEVNSVTGTLGSVGQNSIVLDNVYFPLSSAYQVYKRVSFGFQLFQAGLPVYEGVDVILEITPQVVDDSGSILPVPIGANSWSTGDINLNSGQVAALNNGAGIDLAALLGGGVPKSQYNWSFDFFINGVKIPNSKFSLVTASTTAIFKITDPGFFTWVNDIFSWRFVK